MKLNLDKGTIFVIIVALIGLVGLGILIGQNYFIDDELVEQFERGVQFGVLSLVNRTTYTGNIAYFSEGKIVEVPLEKVCTELNLKGGQK